MYEEFSLPYDCKENSFFVVGFLCSMLYFTKIALSVSVIFWKSYVEYNDCYIAGEVRSNKEV